MPDAPHVVIIGGGFGGLAAAQALKHAPVRITLIDRENHHLFQPLLYQVATAGLSPATSLGRSGVWSGGTQYRVLLGEVTGVDRRYARTVTLDRGLIRYDFLVLATGATHAYFGHDDWEASRPA